MLLALVLLCFVIGAIIGAPYLPTRRRQAEAALDLLALKPGQTVVDLGAGDGSFLRAAAQRGIYATGIEVNPLLFIVAWLRVWSYRHLVSIKLANYWHVSLPPTDAVYVFLIRRYMSRLDRKLRRELTSPTLVASYAFAIPGRRAQAQTNGIFVYKY